VTLDVQHGAPRSRVSRRTSLRAYDPDIYVALYSVLFLLTEFDAPSVRSNRSQRVRLKNLRATRAAINSAHLRASAYVRTSRPRQRATRQKKSVC
jgi:hypothetical protein